MIKELVEKNRSYRRFYQNEKISTDVLRELISLARLSSSGGNLQSLKYILFNDEKKNKTIFNTLGWAGYLKDWSGPKDGEQPSAYIIIVNDSSIGKNYSIDCGIVAQNILLGAVEKGLGGCMLGNIKKKELSSILNLSENYEIALVIALGKPKETIVIDSVDSSGDIKYWRDKNNVHHVPKRSLDEIIIK